MTEIHLPSGGHRGLRLDTGFLARTKRRGWRPIVGLGLAALVSLTLWTLVLAGMWALI